MDQAPAENKPEPVAPAAEAGAKAGAAYGTILGIILIVVILVVGAFYVWGERLEQEQPVLPEDAMQDRSGGSVEIDAEVPQPL